MVPTLGHPILATPGRAFIPNTFSSLASLAQCLVFIGFDNVFFRIDYFSMSASTVSPTLSLLTRPRRLRLHHLRYRHPSSTTAWTRLCHSSRALCARGFMCGYIDIGTPRHRPRHPLALLYRPRLQHPPLSASLTSTQGLSPRMSTPRLPL
jgi:hypothetical protein